MFLGLRTEGLDPISNICQISSKELGALDDNRLCWDRLGLSLLSCWDCCTTGALDTEGSAVQFLVHESDPICGNDQYLRSMSCGNRWKILKNKKWNKFLSKNLRKWNRTHFVEISAVISQLYGLFTAEASCPDNFCMILKALSNNLAMQFEWITFVWALVSVSPYSTTYIQHYTKKQAQRLGQNESFCRGINKHDICNVIFFLQTHENFETAKEKGGKDDKSTNPWTIKWIWKSGMN